MKNWQIDNGTLLLKLTDGSLYHPKSAVLYEQKDNDFFVHAGISYAPLSETNLRFSGLTAHVKLLFSFEETLILKLCFTRNGSKYFVSIYDNVFNDYIIFDSTRRYIGRIVESINTILVLNNINPEDVSYQQYIFLLKEFNKIGIEVMDYVVETVNGIKESVEIETPNGLKAKL